MQDSHTGKDPVLATRNDTCKQRKQAIFFRFELYLLQLLVLKSHQQIFYKNEIKN